MQGARGDIRRNTREISESISLYENTGGGRCA